MLVLKAAGRLTPEPSPEELDQKSYQPILGTRSGAALAATQIIAAPTPSLAVLQNAGPQSVDKLTRDEKIRREEENDPLQAANGS